MTQPFSRHQRSARLAQMFRIAAVACALALFSGCASVQYSALEKVGVHKRDILVDRVEDARDAQGETREELVSAYEQLKNLVEFEGGELEGQYKKLSKAVNRADDATEDLDDRLKSIDRVSEDLFKEWEHELSLYSSDKLREDQTQKLALARKRYGTLRERMQTARDRVDPVMAVLNDNVLFLKHSLNAQALSSLRDQAAQLEGEVDVLIRDMQAAIDEADRFIAQMTG